MKKLLLSLIVMVFAAQLSAQSLSFKYEGETVESGATIDIVSDINDSFEIVFDLAITNNTENTLTIVSQMESDPSNLTQDYLCWGNCYMPGILEASYQVESDSTRVFNGHCSFADKNWELLPVGTVAKMTYSFFDERNPEEKYTFFVNFKYQTEGAEETTSALTFKYEGETVMPGTTIDIVSDINDSFEIVFDLAITNNTENTLTIVSQMESDPSNLTQDYLCWGNCYMPGILEASYQVESDSTRVFNGHCMFTDKEWNTLPVGTVAKMTYIFFDERNPEEKYTFFVNFKYQPESIADFNSVDVFSNAYPNPASSVVSFDYNMPFNVNSASVAIFNMMGQEVVRQNLNLGGSRVDLNVSDLNEGVYFYSLIVNNETVKTNKFVVVK